MVLFVPHGNTVFLIPPFNNPTPLPKPILSESDATYNSSATVGQNLSRYGRYIVIPAFYVMLQNLLKAKREFSIVLHSMSEELLDQVLGSESVDLKASVSVKSCLRWM